VRLFPERKFREGGGKLMPNVRGLIGIIGCSLLGLLATAGAASAQLKSADVGINPTFEQTGASTVNSTGGFFPPARFLPVRPITPLER
jgi:hypothetical protein